MLAFKVKLDKQSENKLFAMYLFREIQLCFLPLCEKNASPMSLHRIIFQIKFPESVRLLSRNSKNGVIPLFRALYKLSFI